LAWKISLSKAAEQSLARLDPPVARRITAFLNGRLAVADNPRALGETLVGPMFRGLWRFRVGDYRLICRIDDGEVHVFVLQIGHRGDIYRP
jgi:mRNA interferase RelE/StbE